MSGVIKKSIAVILSLTAIYFISIYQSNYSKAQKSKNDAIAYYNDAYMDEALEEFEAAFDYGLNDSESLYLLANCYQYVGKFDKSIRTYKNVIKRQPNYTAAYYQISLILFKKKRLIEALDWIKKAIDKDKNFVPAYILGGILKEKLNNEIEANIFYKAAATKDNNVISTEYAKKRLKSLLNSKKGRKSEIPDSSIIPFIDDRSGENNGWYGNVQVSFFSTSGTTPIYYKLRSIEQYKPMALPLSLPGNSYRSKTRFNIEYGYSLAPAYVNKISFRIDSVAPSIDGVFPRLSSSNSTNDAIGFTLKESMSGIDEASLDNSLEVFSLPFMKKIDGDIEYEKTTSILSFRPRDKNKARGAYIAYIKSSIKDKAGNKIARPKVWMFF